MIEVKRLTKYYGPFPAIENVTFSVDQGEIIGFLGPNGAGKTTTMRILTGFSPPTRGSARIAGFDITANPLEVKRRVGYLPESVPLYGEMLVDGFLHYVAEVKGVPRNRRKSEAARVMERCGLTHMSRRLIRNLSKGYRQRVGLAQALVADPPVLILDEPTVGLDPRQIVEIRQMIRDLGKDHTVLLSTHILPEVTMVCERVVIINKGRVVAENRMEDLAGGDTIVIELNVDGPAEKVAAVVQRTASVKTFAAESPGTYIAECRAVEDLDASLAGALVQAGLKMRGLRRRTRTLEDIFLEAITSEEEELA